MSVAEKENPSVWEVLPEDGQDWATSEGVLKGIDELSTALENGADPDEEGAVLKAVIDGDIDVVKALHKAGAELLMARDYAERSVLHYMSDAEVCEYVLEYTNNVDLQDINGQTPLHDAVACNDADKVWALLDAGADLYIADNDQWNAMHYAASYRADEQIIELLLDADTDNELFDLENNSGQTPWDIAEDNGHADTIRSVIAQREKAQITKALAEHMSPSELMAQDDVQQAPSCEARQKARRAM